MAIDALDRFRGCLMGLAVGDALGTTIEFSPPRTFVPIHDIVGGGPFGLQPGQWTDDTSMALCLATSLTETGTCDVTDQMNRYVRWWREGYLSSIGRCFDIGITTSEALERFESTGNPFAGSSDPDTAGNGSLMRLAPVPMFYASEPNLAILFSAQSSRTTHAAVEAIDGCRYFASLLVGALNGDSHEALTTTVHAPEAGYWDRIPLTSRILEIAQGSFREKGPPEIRGTGYVVKSLEAVLWAFYHSKDFRSGAILAVNLGDDADTTGAIYGQLAGAHYGFSGIPESWSSIIAMRDEIIALADRLYANCKTL